MTLTTPTVHTEPAFARAFHPDASARDRLLLIEGRRGSGKTRALAAIAAAARTDGHHVIEIRVTTGDPTVSAGSLDALLGLLPAASVPDVPRLVLVDDLDRLDPAAQGRVQGLLLHLAHRTRAVCVATVTDRQAVDRWPRVPHVVLDPAAAIARTTGEDAAVDAAFLGDFAAVDALLAGRSAPVAPPVAAAAAWVRAVRCGEIREAHRDVRRLVERSDGARGDAADLPAAVLQLTCFLQGDARWWDDAIAACAGLRLDPVLRLVEECLGARPPADRAGLLAAVRASVADGRPWKLVALHVAWSLLDALDPRRDELEELLGLRREQHDLPGYLALCRRTVAAFQAGRLEVAAGGFVRAREHAEALGAQTFVALIDAFQALVHAVRGERDLAAAKAEQAADWALRNGAPLVAQAADQARSSLDLALGRFEEAYARTSGERPAGGHWIERGYGPIGLLDAVESAARLRLPAHGQALIQAAESALGSHRTPRQTLVLLAARAILDERGETQRLFEASLDSLQLDDAPFEVARVRLAYGEWLRRSMQALNARVQFRLAESAFRALGATDWTDRAHRELRAAGGADEGGDSAAASTAELSEQELRVASLAASGLSNKQIGSRLYLSPRTVSGHLYRVFPKLGITSRAALRDALDALRAADARTDGDQTARSIRSAATTTVPTTSAANTRSTPVAGSTTSARPASSTGTQRPA